MCLFWRRKLCVTPTSPPSIENLRIYEQVNVIYRNLLRHYKVHCEFVSLSSRHALSLILWIYTSTFILADIQWAHRKLWSVKVESNSVKLKEATVVSRIKNTFLTGGQLQNKQRFVIRRPCVLLKNSRHDIFWMGHFEINFENNTSNIYFSFPP